jgi:thiosulfate/3-mercaptopyruvate sulfurtransferase
LINIVSADWVAERIGKTGVTAVDPRRPMKYLAGHLPEAINVPVYQAFGADGALLEPTGLAAFVGSRGIGERATVVIYDSPEGQNAAMLAWILEYVGAAQINVMAEFFEKWKASGRDVRYRPVIGEPQSFTARPNPSVRLTLDEARSAKGLRFVDFRSREEFIGERTIGEDTPGHIPGAINLEWRELASSSEGIKSSIEVEAILAKHSMVLTERFVAYCRSGPRAALGYVALRRAGYDVRLFDGSWAQWSRHHLPAEKQG